MPHAVNDWSYRKDSFSLASGAAGQRPASGTQGFLA
jgi:hypothetical protein